MSNPLPLLVPHLPTFIASLTFFCGAQYASHTLSPKVYAKYRDFDQRTKNSWATHVVSMTHAILILPLAFRCLSSKTLAEDPVFGYDPFVGQVLAFSSGYFLWDTVDSMVNSTIGFVVHGAACLAVYLFSFRPFLAGFGPPFLLWELSTPFLNIHWFMDKSGLSTRYPTAFLVNALVFMLVFFLARIVYGGANSLHFFHTMWTQRKDIPLHLHVIYCAGNLSLNGLNWLWFSKMLKKMWARLQGTDKSAPAQSVPQASFEANAERRPLLQADKRDVITDLQAIAGGEDEASLAMPANPPSPIARRGDDERW
ncbi:hypothetical protein IAU60_001647 [Kwoniella sp. DSM 27419]